MTNRVGRPEKEFNWEVLDAILQYGASKLDCAELTGVSEDTIDRRIKEEHGKNFSEYREAKKSKMRMKLRQKQFEMALKGNVPLLIWLGKNELGQSDKNEMEAKLQTIKIDKDDGQL